MLELIGSGSCSFRLIPMWQIPHRHLSRMKISRTLNRSMGRPSRRALRMWNACLRLSRDRSGFARFQSFAVQRNA